MNSPMYGQVDSDLPCLNRECAILLPTSAVWQYYPWWKKILEAVVNRRLAFVNEAFQEYDKYNNDFISGSRTSDNLFILKGLIERQLSIGRKLYVCFVDFCKAFDLINRVILFYKLMNSEWKGRVIDTFRSLYRNTHFRVKRHGNSSPPLLNNIGVNQGEIASELMLRKICQTCVITCPKNLALWYQATL